MFVYDLVEVKNTVVVVKDWCKPRSYCGYVLHVHTFNDSPGKTWCKNDLK